MIIYKITNLINFKIYYGQTIQSIEKRFQQHIRGSKYKDNYMLIARAINKYGKDNFKIEQIKKCNSQKELDAWESLFILFAKLDKYGCYNIAINKNSYFNKQKVILKYSSKYYKYLEDYERIMKNF